MLPSWLTDQEEETIKKHGYTFRDFSSEQVMGELWLRGMEKDLPLQAFTEQRYLSQGYKKKKSTSISGGYVWSKND